MVTRVGSYIQSLRSIVLIIAYRHNDRPKSRVRYLILFKLLLKYTELSISHWVTDVQEVADSHCTATRIDVYVT